MSIAFHRLVRPIDINRLIFIDYYRLNRLISDDRLSSIGHTGCLCTRATLRVKFCTVWTMQYKEMTLNGFLEQIILLEHAI